MWDWLSSEEALLVYGALLAGIVGVVTQWWQRERVAKARRAALFQLLSKRLWALPTKQPAYDPSQLLTSGTIQVSAVGQLLNVPLLDARTHAKLISGLTNWQQLELTLNALVYITNQVLLTKTLAPEYHRAWHDHLDFQYGMLIARRGDLIGHLPTECRPEGWQPGPEGPETEGQLIEHRI